MDEFENRGQSALEHTRGCVDAVCADTPRPPEPDLQPIALSPRVVTEADIDVWRADPAAFDAPMVRGDRTPRLRAVKGHWVEYERSREDEHDDRMFVRTP